MNGNNDFSHEIVGVNYEVACVAGVNGGVEWIGRQKTQGRSSSSRTLSISTFPTPPSFTPARQANYEVHVKQGPRRGRG